MNPGPTLILHAFIATLLAFSAMTGSKGALGPPASIYKPAGSVRAIAVSNGFAYIGLSPKGLEVVSLADINQPKRVGFMDTTGPVRKVVLSGNRAFVLDSEAGMLTVDLQDPVSPRIEGSYKEIHRYSDFLTLVQEDYIYVHDDLNSLAIIDISVPQNPVQVGRAPINTETKMSISGNYAFVGVWDGFETLDLSDPLAPRLVGAFRASMHPEDMVVAGNYAYLAYTYGRLNFGHFRILDLTDPANPTTAGSFGFYHDPWRANYYRVAVWRNRAFLVAVGSQSRVTIHVFDITDPTDPRLLNILDFPESIWELLVHNDQLFVAAGDEGLFTFDLTLPSLAIYSDDEDLVLSWTGNGPLQVQRRDTPHGAEWKTIYEPEDNETRLALPLFSPAAFFRLIRTP